LRYPGFCEITAAAKEIGLISEEIVPAGMKNWPDLIRWLLTSEMISIRNNPKLNLESVKLLAESIGVCPFMLGLVMSRTMRYGKFWDRLTPE
jgi:hypothetical protein